MVLILPIDPAGIADGRFFALVRSEDLRDATKLVEEPGGLLPGAPVVAGAAELAEEGRCARLRPAAPLEARAGYAVLVGTRVRSADGRLVLDPEGRRRVFAWTFETGDTPDRIAPAPLWIAPPHGPVARNLRTLRVGFGEPVTGSMELPAGAGPPRPAPAGPGELALELEGLLAPGQLAPVLARVRDAAGNAATGSSRSRSGTAWPACRRCRTRPARRWWPGRPPSRPRRRSGRGPGAG